MKYVIRLRNLKNNSMRELSKKFPTREAAEAEGRRIVIAKPGKIAYHVVAK